MKGKLRAFTLIEVIIALALAGIVTTISVMGFQIISKNFENYKKSNADYLAVATVHQVMIHDLELSKFVRKTVSGFVCNTQTHSIEYKFEETFLIRNINTVNDTMAFNVGRCEFLYNHMEQNITGELIDEIEININQDQNSLLIHLVKWYAANIKLNNL